MISLAQRIQHTPSPSTEKMLLLREHTTESELKDAVQSTRGFPELLFTHFRLINHLKKALPDSVLRVFSYPYENPIYWFTIEISDAYNERPRINIGQSSAKHDTTVFLTALKMFLEEIKPMVLHHSLLIQAEGHLMNDLSTIFEQVYEKYFIVNKKYRRETTVFYSSEDQRHWLATEGGSELPYGYSLGTVNPKEDSETLATNWATEVKEGPSAEYLKQLMSSMPSSCITKLNEETNEVEGKTAFVLQSQYGDMAFHFTTEEHRRRGLGRAVEIDLAKRIAKNGEIPFKAVSNYNDEIVRRSEDAPYWTVWTRGGAPVQLVLQPVQLRE